MSSKITIISFLTLLQGVIFINSAKAQCVPTTITPDQASLPTVNGTCSVSSITAPTATNDCGQVITGITTTTFPIVNQGSTTVTWTFDDGQGNVSTQDQSVLLDDTVIPTITAPADVVTGTDPGMCTASNVVLGAPSIVDNCSALIIVNDAPATFPTGITTVTWTVTDVGGNSVSAVQNVKVTDMESPVVICPGNQMVNANPGLCYATAVAVSAPVATENCTLSSLVHNAPAQFPVGVTTITWVATDAEGNTGTCSQDITVIETIPPTATGPAPVYVEEIINVPAPDPSVITNVSDNCGTPVVSWLGDISDGQTCPETITRSYLVDDGNGNTTTLFQLIHVMDMTPPTASNPTPLTVECTADIPVPDPLVVTNAADNLSIPSIGWVSDVSDGQSCPETITRTYAIIDDCENTTYVEQIITVEDLTAPVPELASLPQLSHQCEIAPEPPTAMDNCNIQIAGIPDVQFPITTPGVTTITWSYIDPCGNTTTQTQDVEIIGVDASAYIANDGVSIYANNATATYQWVDCSNNTVIPNELIYHYTPTYNGTFAVIVTENGCSETSDCIEIYSLGIDQEEIVHVKMYPNPSATGLFEVEADQQIIDVKMIDLSGRSVNINVDLSSGNIDASGLSSGSYVVHVQFEDGVVYQGSIILE